MKKLKHIIMWILFPASMMMAMAYDEYEHDRVMDEDLTVNVSRGDHDSPNGDKKQLTQGTTYHFHMFFGIAPLVWHYCIDDKGIVSWDYNTAKDKSHEE